MHKRFKPFNLMLSFLLAGLPLSACQGEPTEKTIKVKIEKTWTIDMARDEAFQDTPEIIQIDNYAKVDPDFVTNRLHPSPAKVRVVFFGQEAYGVSPACSNETLTYDASGSLIEINIGDSPAYSDPLRCPITFPAVTRTYAAIDYVGVPAGRLLSVTISTSMDDEYTFDDKKVLRTHYVGNKCYHADGSFCGTRTPYNVEVK